jgi:hypothetical protein
MLFDLLQASLLNQRNLACRRKWHQKWLDDQIRAPVASTCPFVQLHNYPFCGII